MNGARRDNQTFTAPNSGNSAYSNSRANVRKNLAVEKIQRIAEELKALMEKMRYSIYNNWKIGL